MEKLGLILAFYTFIGCLWWVAAKITGTVFMKFLGKMFGITGCVISCVYILKYFNLI
jgi:hypothetical protein